MNTVPCKGCGRSIFWALNPISGKRVPLDPKPPVYRIQMDTGQVFAHQDKQAFVSHFATCPNANDFSGSGRR